MISTIIGDEVYFHRGFVKMLGGVKPAIMLSFACRHQNVMKRGIWEMSYSEWEKETGLTSLEQNSARRVLRKFPFWREGFYGTPPRLHYGIDQESLLNQLGVLK